MGGADAVARAIRRVHGSCLSPLLVPLALVAWSKRLPQRICCAAHDEYVEAEEYVVEATDSADALNLEQRAPSSNSVSWPALLQVLRDFVAEATEEADADAAWDGAATSMVHRELEALGGIIRLEQLRHLA